MPQKAAGIRILPPPSVPTAHGPIPAATAAAAPPDEPPGVSCGSIGLRVIPVRGLSVTAFHASSGVVVLPTKTIPSARHRAVTADAPSQDCPASPAFDPGSAGQPAGGTTRLMRTAP